MRRQNLSGATMSLRVLCILPLLGLLALTGCGSTESVTGTVTLDGAPLPDAEVTFTPVGGGRPGMATTGPDGTFSLNYTMDETGAPAGKYDVTVTTGTTKEGPDGKDIVVPEKVPAAYHESGMIVREVKPGANDFKIDLKADAEGPAAAPADPDTC